MATKRLIAATNLAIVVVAVLLGIVCVKRFFFAAKGPTPLPAIPVGTKISIPNVEWSQSRGTVLIALQKGCHFCTESAPFYKRLVAKTAGNKNLHLMAVLPQDPATARSYLDSLGVAIADIQQLELNKIGVSGTPTLLLIDDQGAVKASWIGTLSEQQESDIFRKIGAIS